MGDIILTFRVRMNAAGRGRQLRLYFDTGSLHSFVKQSVARRAGSAHELSEPMDFGGLGNGRFRARGIVHFSVRLLRFWCPHYAYVVEDGVLGDGYDLLIGHGFMRGFNVRCNPRRRRIDLDVVSLRLAQTVRRQKSRGCRIRHSENFRPGQCVNWA